MLRYTTFKHTLDDKFDQPVKSFLRHSLKKNILTPDAYHVYLYFIDKLIKIRKYNAAAREQLVA